MWCLKKSILFVGILCFCAVSLLVAGVSQVKPIERKYDVVSHAPPHDPFYDLLGKIMGEDALKNGTVTRMKRSYIFPSTESDPDLAKKDMSCFCICTSFKNTEALIKRGKFLSSHCAYIKNNQTHMACQKVWTMNIYIEKSHQEDKDESEEGESILDDAVKAYNNTELYEYFDEHEEPTTDDPSDETITDERGDVNATDDPCDETITDEPGDVNTTEQPGDVTTYNAPGDVTTTDEPGDVDTTDEPGDVTTTETADTTTPIPSASEVPDLIKTNVGHFFYRVLNSLPEDTDCSCDCDAEYRPSITPRKRGITRCLPVSPHPSYMCNELTVYDIRALGELIAAPIVSEEITTLPKPVFEESLKYAKKLLKEQELMKTNADIDDVNSTINEENNGTLSNSDTEIYGNSDEEEQDESEDNDDVNSTINEETNWTLLNNDTEAYGENYKEDQDESEGSDTSTAYKNIPVSCIDLARLLRGAEHLRDTGGVSSSTNEEINRTLLNKDAQIYEESEKGDQDESEGTPAIMSDKSITYKNAAVPSIDLFGLLTGAQHSQGSDAAITYKNSAVAGIDIARLLRGAERSQGKPVKRSVGRKKKQRHRPPAWLSLKGRRFWTEKNVRELIRITSECRLRIELVRVYYYHRSGCFFIAKHGSYDELEEWFREIIMGKRKPRNRKTNSGNTTSTKRPTDNDGDNGSQGYIVTQSLLKTYGLRRPDWLNKKYWYIWSYNEVNINALEYVVLTIYWRILDIIDDTQTCTNIKFFN